MPSRSFQEEVGERLGEREQLGERAMTLQMKSVLRRLEPRSRQWAVLIAHGALDAAVNLTRETISMNLLGWTAGRESIPLSETGAPTQTINALKIRGIKTIGDWQRLSEEEQAKLFPDEKRAYSHRRWVRVNREVIEFLLSL